MIFYLVRHGQTDWNSERRLQGHRNIPLNAEGIHQMSVLADKIRENGIIFDTMISSTLDRARMSAEIIAQRTGFGKEIVFDSDFIERGFGILEGEIWKPELNLEDPRYGVETIGELCARAEKALNKYTFSEDGKIMIVTHGAIMGALRTVLSDYRIDYHDRTVPIIQGNVLCCIKEEGKETVFFNMF